MGLFIICNNYNFIISYHLYKLDNKLAKIFPSFNYGNSVFIIFPVKYINKQKNMAGHLLNVCHVIELNGFNIRDSCKLFLCRG
jgi:hypothetical protein